MAGFFLDDAKSVPADGVGIACAIGWREPRAFVVDFDEQTVPLERGMHVDPAVPVNDGVGHQFAYQQLGRLLCASVELGGEQIR